MPVLALGTPVTVADPVTPDREPAQATGRYRFELVVTDTAGLESDPALLDVTVFEPARPNPRLRPPATR